MRAGPDIALMASMIGDPARANMLVALMSGMALTAGELALEAGVSASTASFHLAKLGDAGLVVVRRQGRHRYFALSGPEVAGVIEALMTATETWGPRRVRPGPKEPALRQARVCYDHLAGELGVLMFERLSQSGAIVAARNEVTLTPAGVDQMARLGIDPAAIRLGSRSLCRPCLDWSERRAHLAGIVGRLLLERVVALGWARREPGSRAVRFTAPGIADFHLWLGSPAPR